MRRDARTARSHAIEIVGARAIDVSVAKHMAVASLFEELLDQYKIEQRIAEKRYTDLYQAYDVDDDRLVRLDIVRPGLAEDNGFASRLVNRARAVAQIRHPRIAPIYHIGKTTDGRPYVAQAHIDGLPLSQRLEQLAQRETPVNALYALKLVRQLADALVLAERLELLHHDLQPDNIWLKNVALTGDESLVLLDLFIPAERRPAASGGSEAYRPPEQRAGREITAAGHVYSLGVLLYHLLVGQLPEGPVTLRAVMLSRLRARPSALERWRPGLSRLTYDLVERCLRRDPAQRYESVEAFLAALDGAVVAEEARLGMAAERLAAPRRSLGWLLPVLIFVLVAAVAAGAARWQRQTAALASPTAIAVVGANAPTASLPTADAAMPVLSPTAAPTEPPTEVPATAAPAGEVGALPSPTAAPTEPPPDTPTATVAPTDPPTPTAGPTRVPVVRVVLNQVNLRRGPGTVYNTIGSLRSGDALQVLAWNDDRENPWYLVLTEDQRTGWVSAEVVWPEDTTALAAVPAAATLPPTPFPTVPPAPLPTSTPVLIITPSPTLPSSLGDGGDDGGETPPPAPTDAPTEPAIEPTPTPPPLP